MFFKGEVHLLEHLRSSWHVASSPGPPIFFSFCDGSRRAFFWFRVYANWRTTKWGRPGNEATWHGCRNSYWTMGSNLMLHNCSAWINTTWKVLKLFHSIGQGPLSPSVYLGRHWCLLHDKCSLTSPSPFAYCTCIKWQNWTVGRPENKVSSSSLPSYKTTLFPKLIFVVHSMKTRLLI